MGKISLIYLNKMNPYIVIAGRKIGLDFDPLVIAEIGINHEGSLKTAFEMVDSAKAGGAEIIKHQTHIVDDEMSSEARNVVPGNADVSIYTIMERCALSEEEECKLQAYVESKGMIFFSSPFSRAAVDRLERMNVPAFKVGSGECNNYPLLEHIARIGKPIILSTGMNTMDSISKAVDIFEKHGVPYALLHCTNVYPTPPHLVRLGAITELMQRFPNTPIGLSDHTTDNFACLGAVALGASILERHFTDRMDRPGPDIINSMDQLALSELVKGSKVLKQERGGNKGILEEEKVTIDFAYATVVTIANIAEGEELTMDNIWVKRPGTGEIQAENFHTLLGKKAANAVKSDCQLGWSDIVE